MQRLFVALALPLPITQHLLLLQGGIPGARWENPDKMHLTLRFIGDVDGSVKADLVDQLGRVSHDPFELTVAGVGHFPPRGQPRAVWAGIEDNVALLDLAAKVERAVQRAGLDPERRRFSPHITLARLRNAPIRKVGEYLAMHNLLRTEPFVVDTFELVSSVLNPRGSSYRFEQSFALE